MNTDPEILFDSNFKQAANDYLWFLEKKYPQKIVLELVGNRYKLNRIQRSILYRGVISRQTANVRESKLFKDKVNKIRTLHIDCFNVLITISSYLNGNIVYVGLDGYLRDASEIHSKVFRTDLLEKSLHLLLDYLLVRTTGEVYFYIDEPVNSSDRLYKIIVHLLDEKKMTGKAIKHKSPDHLISSVKDGVIITTDTTIIDRSTLPVLDLGQKTLTFFYHPEFIDLRTIIL